MLDGVEAQSALVEEAGARFVPPAPGVGPPQVQRLGRRCSASHELNVEVVGPRGARIVFVGLATSPWPWDSGRAARRSSDQECYALKGRRMLYTCKL